MLQLFKTIFAKKLPKNQAQESQMLETRPAPSKIVVEGMDSLALTEFLNWHLDLPIPDWLAIDAWLETAADEAMRNMAYSACERAWLQHFAQALGVNYHLAESEKAIVLSSMSSRNARSALDYIERTGKRIAGALDGLAEDKFYGKELLIVFDTEDDYYRYVSCYYPEEGEFAFSAGMHIDYGCGHFVTIKNDNLSQIEPTIAHEMTHSSLAHLCLPRWIDEGLAVNMEHRLTKQGSSSWTPQEMREKHLRFWGVAEIQEFWSGDSFHRTDDGNLLSYDLARILIEQFGRDWKRFQQFVLTADRYDGGARAMRECFGITLGAVFAALFEKEYTDAFEPVVTEELSDSVA